LSGLLAETNFSKAIQSDLGFAVLAGKPFSLLARRKKADDVGSLGRSGHAAARNSLPFLDPKRMSPKSDKRRGVKKILSF
jgi:hypothetical protein